jgi:hypothetical protein
MYLHDHEYCMGLRLSFYDLERCKVTRHGIVSLQAARTKLFCSMYSVTIISPVRSALAHDRDVEAIINRKTFLTRHLHAYPHSILRSTNAWFGGTLTHASHGRPVTNVSAQPTQHLGSLDTEGLAKCWYLLLWQLFGFCQKVSHRLQLRLSISSHPQKRHMTDNPRPKAENICTISHQVTRHPYSYLTRYSKSATVASSPPSQHCFCKLHHTGQSMLIIIQPPHQLLHPICAERAVPSQ